MTVIKTTYCHYQKIEKAVEPSRVYFDRYNEPKWVEFCKKHGFDPFGDARGKKYDIYLQMCAYGMI